MKTQSSVQLPQWKSIFGNGIQKLGKSWYQSFLVFANFDWFLVFLEIYCTDTKRIEPYFLAVIFYKISKCWRIFQKFQGNKQEKNPTKNWIIICITIITALTMIIILQFLLLIYHFFIMFNAFHITIMFFQFVY